MNEEEIKDELKKLDDILEGVTETIKELNDEGISVSVHVTFNKSNTNRLDFHEIAKDSSNVKLKVIGASHTKRFEADNGGSW